MAAPGRPKSVPLPYTGVLVAFSFSAPMKEEMLAVVELSLLCLARLRSLYITNVNKPLNERESWVCTYRRLFHTSDARRPRMKEYNAAPIKPHNTNKPMVRPMPSFAPLERPPPVEFEDDVDVDVGGAENGCPCWA